MFIIDCFKVARIKSDVHSRCYFFFRSLIVVARDSGKLTKHCFWSFFFFFRSYQKRWADTVSSKPSVTSRNTNIIYKQPEQCTYTYIYIYYNYNCNGSDIIVCDVIRFDNLHLESFDGEQERPSYFLLIKKFRT